MHFCILPLLLFVYCLFIQYFGLSVFIGLIIERIITVGELIVNGIKWAFFIAVGLTFMTAISTLLNLITSVVFANVIGEVLALLSVCLPFNALAVFSSLGTACSAILSFLIAQKIYNLTSAKLNL